MSSELTPKQARFVEEYLIDLNATQAAIRAGYSEKTARQIGEENLSKPDIATAIGKAMAERSARTEITADRVLKELAKIGFADIRKAVSWRSNVVGMVEGEDGEERLVANNEVTLINSDELDDDTAAAIGEVSQGKGGTLKIKFHDKKGALVDIGRHLGMFTDKVELGGAVRIIEVDDTFANG